MIETPLFQGKLVRLTLPDLQADGPIEAAWSTDLSYLQALGLEPRPISAFSWQKLQTAAAEKKDEPRFAIRTLDGDRLVGIARLHNLHPTHRRAAIQIGVGAAEDRGRGYGSEALGLLLRFAFHELNLERLEAETDSGHPEVVNWLEAAGFVFEVRRREALYRLGRRVDQLCYALLRTQWSAAQPVEGSR